MAIIPMNDAAGLRSAGIHYPSTPESWRWLYRTRAERGVAAAFIRCGRRILIDSDRLLELMRKSQQGSGAPTSAGISAPPASLGVPSAAPAAKVSHRRGRRPTAEQITRKQAGAT